MLMFVFCKSYFFLWFLIYYVPLLSRNTLDLVTLNFLLEAHNTALLNTSGSFSAIGCQCLMKHRGEESIEIDNCSVHQENIVQYLCAQ
jgi:hypothetical protein